MYEISVEREFCAAHALVIKGAREPIHGHNFRVTLTLQGLHLDSDGLLIDFHALERVVMEILSPMTNVDLGTLACFAHASPTAENIARHVALATAARLREITGDTAGVRVASCRVTEAPGCSATYRPTRAEED